MNANPPVYFGIAGWPYPDRHGTLYPPGLLARYPELKDIAAPPLA